MATRTRILLAAAAALCCTCAPALAADYDPPLLIDAAEEYVPVEVGSGWYLRGDIGYVFQHEADDFTYRTFDAGTGTYGSASFDSAELDQDVTFSAGFGYRYNDFLRGDLTVDGFRARFGGSTSSAAPCVDDPIFAGTGCVSSDEASMSAIGLMANGYVDLGTYVGLTPYVGAGAGYSYVSWSGLDSSYACVDAGGACPGLPIADAERDGLDDWRFTYALMAGVAYDVNKNLKIDLGYKYRHIEGGDMFGFSSAESAAGASGTSGSDSDLTQHEVKVGLRYELW